MANPIIEKFTGLVDFKVDESSLSSLNRTLDNIASKLSGISARTSQIAAREAIIQQRLARAEEASSRARLNYARATQTITNAIARAGRSELDAASRLARIQNDNRRLNVLEIRARMDGLRQVGQLSLDIIENETRARLAAERTRRDAANATARQEIQNSRERMQAERLANRAAGGGGGGGSGRGFGAAGHLGIAGVIGSYAAPYLGFQGLTGIVREARQAAGLEMAFTSLAGDKAKGAEELGWLRKTTDYLGLNYLDSGEQYKQIYGSAKSNVGAGGARQIFKGFGSAFTVLGMDKEQTKRSYKAIGQMLNKEQVMSEELKSQLSEGGYAGVMDLFARAASAVKGKEISTKQFIKMMEKAQVGTDVVLKAAQLAEEDANKGGALDERRKSDIAAQGRFESKRTDIYKKLYDGGLSSGLSKFFTELSNAMERLQPHMDKMGNILGELIGFAGDLAKVLADNLGLAIQTISAGVDGLNGLFSSLGLSFSVTEGGLAKLGIALWAFARHPAIAAIMSAFAAIQSMMYFFDNDPNTRSIFDKKQVLLDTEGNVAWERNSEKEDWQSVMASGGSGSPIRSKTEKIRNHLPLSNPANIAANLLLKVSPSIGEWFGERKLNIDESNYNQKKAEEQGKIYLNKKNPQSSINIQNLNVNADNAQQLVESLQSLSISYNIG